MPVISELIERTVVFIGEHVPGEVIAFAALTLAVLCFVHAIALALGVPNRSWWRGEIRISIQQGPFFTAMGLNVLARETGREGRRSLSAVALVAAFLVLGVTALQRAIRDLGREP